MFRNKKNQPNKENQYRRQREVLDKIQTVGELEYILITCCGPNHTINAEKLYGTSFSRSLVEEVLKERRFEEALFGV